MPRKILREQRQEKAAVAENIEQLELITLKSLLILRKVNNCRLQDVHILLPDNVQILKPWIFKAANKRLDFYEFYD